MQAHPKVLLVVFMKRPVQPTTLSKRVSLEQGNRPERMLRTQPHLTPHCNYQLLHRTITMPERNGWADLECDPVVPCPFVLSAAGLLKYTFFLLIRYSFPIPKVSPEVPCKSPL